MKNPTSHASKQSNANKKHNKVRTRRRKRETKAPTMMMIITINQPS